VKEPKLSIVVVAYRMARQAANTLYSLSARFQRNVDEDDYEVLLIENDSDDELGREAALAQGKNIRYFYRKEPGASPVPALNFGFSQARAPFVGFIIDGARMVTPGVVEHTLLARRLCDWPLVVVPGYHLGEKEHHLNQTAGHDEQSEQRLLDRIDWKENGYELFSISCFSGANPRGFLTQFLETNCFFCRRESFEKIGRADSRFTLAGGGSVNIYLYHALACLPESKLIVLAGEGSFHQFHGGVTASELADREAELASHRENLAEVFGGPFKGMHREPLVLGALPGPAQPFLETSARRAFDHYKVCKAKGIPQWNRPDGAS
jgi:glycosyltransferase involved in cell wall biosynthesis